MSTAGGRAPAWRGDGHELFYLAHDTTLMGVDVSLAGSKPVIGAPQPLFATNSDPDRVIRTTYAAASDGQRFLVMTPLVHPSASAMVGVLNWTASIAKR